MSKREDSVVHDATTRPQKKIRRLSLNRLKTKSLDHKSSDEISPTETISPRDYSFVKKHTSVTSVTGIFSPRKSPKRSPKSNLTHKMYHMLSLDPVKNYQLIKSILYITLELLNNDTFFKHIKFKDICGNFLELMTQAKRPLDFLNFCLDLELRKSSYVDIFRENTPTNNAILSFMNMDNKDGNFLSVFASRYIEDKEYSDIEILNLITGIVNQFFTIVPFYSSTFFYVLKYIQDYSNEHKKDPYKIITILLFLRVINPAITYCYNPSDSSTLKKNKLRVIKTLMKIANQMVSAQGDDYLEFNDGNVSLSEEQVKIYSLKELIISKLKIMDISKGEKIKFPDTDLDFKFIVNFASYILKTHEENNILPILSDNDNIEKLIITNLCKLIAMIGCGEQETLDNDSKELIKKLLSMNFMV